MASICSVIFIVPISAAISVKRAVAILRLGGTAIGGIGHSVAVAVVGSTVRKIRHRLRRVLTALLRAEQSRRARVLLGFQQVFLRAIGIALVELDARELGIRARQRELVRRTDVRAGVDHVFERVFEPR